MPIKAIERSATVQIVASENAVNKPSLISRKDSLSSMQKEQKSSCIERLVEKVKEFIQGLFRCLCCCFTGSTELHLQNQDNLRMSIPEVIHLQKQEELHKSISKLNVVIDKQTQESIEKVQNSKIIPEDDKHHIIASLRAFNEAIKKAQNTILIADGYKPMPIKAPSAKAVGYSELSPEDRKKEFENNIRSMAFLSEDDKQRIIASNRGVDEAIKKAQNTILIANGYKPMPEKAPSAKAVDYSKLSPKDRKEEFENNIRSMAFLSEDDKQRLIASNRGVDEAIKKAQNTLHTADG
jgi:hypothetical protein